VKSYSVEAVVLRMRALGEADRIVTLFSRERGKQSVVARGARRVGSKFGGRLDFFTRARLMLHSGASLDIITSVHTVKAIWEKLVDPDTYAAAAYVAECIDALCEPDLAVPELYETLCGFMEALDRGVDRDALLAAVDLRILNSLGFAPELDACARCGAQLGRRPLSRGRAHLSAQAGGLLCSECVKVVRLESSTIVSKMAKGSYGGGVTSIGADEFLALRALRALPLVDVSASRHSRLQAITRMFVEYQMGRRSRALSVVTASSTLKRATARKA
jgi:DNA repair protein RecO (recombination protein O)